MPPLSLTLKALGEQIARPARGWRNRVRASRAGFGKAPEVAVRLPEPVLLGDAGLGQELAAGRWVALGHTITVGKASIWSVALPDPRLEAERQACLWLDDLAALGNRPARVTAQGWVQDWIHRYGSGRGPGWEPALAGRRAMRWSVHAAMLTQDLNQVAAGRFWRTLARQRRYLATAWPEAAEGLPRLQALAGLVWAGIVVPHSGHAAALAEMAALAETLVDASGGTPTRAPEDLAQILVLLIWTARLLEDAGQHAMAPHLQAILRAVPVIRPLRLGDGGTARFHGGGAGDAGGLDQALAELKLVAQPKPALPMGFARLQGGRMVVVMDGAAPPAGSGHAATLAFEMSAGRQRLVVNAGPGQAFGPGPALLSRETRAQSAAEVGGLSSARIDASGLAGSAFGPRLVEAPSLVAVRQAQDASGQWLVATQDGYVGRLGLLHERRLFVDARGQELRGEDILSVPDAGARARFERAAPSGSIGFAVRFHLHPAAQAELDEVRQLVLIALPSQEVWMFRAGGGVPALEDSVTFDPVAAAPQPTSQVVVRAEVVGYLGQITWSFSRIAEPAAR